MPPEGEQFPATGRVPHLGRPVPTPGRQPRPVRRPGHGNDPVAVADEGVLLQVAKALPVIPLEAPLGVRLGLRQQCVQPTYLAGVPGRLHQVDAGRIPLPPHLLLRRAGPVGLSLGLGLRLFGQRSLLALPIQGPFGLHITDRGNPGHRGQQDEDRRHQPGHHRVPLAPPPGPLRGGDPPRPDRLVGQEPPQVLRQGGRGRVAPGRLLVEALQADRLEVARQLRHQPRRRHRLAPLDLLQGLQRRGGPERRPAGQQLVEDRPQGVDVRRRARLPGLTAGLLGGHVAGRAHDQVGPRQGRLAVQHLGQAEVGDLGRAVGRQQDVGRLQVAVHDPQPVRLGHRAGQLFDQAGRPLRRPGGAVELPVQAAAGHVLQLEEGQAVGLADVVDLDDVRVLEPGDRLGLGQEAGDGLGRRHGRRPGSSSGAGAIEPDLACLVDDAHAAAAQLAEDLIAGDRGRGRSAGAPDAAGDPGIVPRRSAPPRAVPSGSPRSATGSMIPGGACWSRRRKIVCSPVTPASASDRAPIPSPSVRSTHPAGPGKRRSPPRAPPAPRTRRGRVGRPGKLRADRDPGSVHVISAFPTSGPPPRFAW